MLNEKLYNQKNTQMPELIKEIKCVVFDLDDTLHNETDYCKSGFITVSAMLAEQFDLCREDIFNRIWQLFCEGKRQNIFNAALSQLNISFDEELINSLVKHYRGHYPDIKLSKSSREVLDILKDKTHLALLTDGFLPAQMYKVQALEIEDYFEKIVYTEQLGRSSWKPSTDGFKLIMDFFGFEPHNYLYIGDNPAKDFIAPNKLGWRTVFFNNEQKVNENFAQDKTQAAEFEISKISELPKLLGYVDRN